MTRRNRRSVLRLLGAGAGVALGMSGQAAAGSGRGDREELRLFGEAEVPMAHETVVQGNYAYVATGTRGMAIVDWHHPGRPEVVAEVDLAEDIEENLGIQNPVVEILDVQVDGDVAALANNGSTDPGGISLYDVSDPTDPQFLAQYQPDLGGPTTASGAAIHNCYLEDGFAYLTLHQSWNIDTDGDGSRDKVWLFGNAGVEIADVRRPSDPEFAGRWFLKDEAPADAKSSRAPCHDIYVQGDICYAALWDAGTAALNVRNPANPELISRFGSSLSEDDAIPAWDVTTSIVDYLVEHWDAVAYEAPPGNAHYVQPSPDGDHVYVGAETFLGAPGGIDVWDVSDLASPESVGRIDAPDVDAFRTAHNFDVTNDRLHASWYNAGVRIYDTTDPSEPVELAHYDPDGYSFWSAVSERGFTIGGVYGSRSIENEGGITVLHADRGKRRPPGFDGAEPPSEPGIMPNDRR